MKDSQKSTKDATASDVEAIVMPTAGDKVQVYDSCAQQDKVEEVVDVINHGRYSDGTLNISVVTLRKSWNGFYKAWNSPKLIRRIVN